MAEETRPPVTVGKSRSFLARIATAVEEYAETADAEQSRRLQTRLSHPPTGQKAVVTPLTPAEEKLWKEFGGCYRRLNNNRD